MTDSNVAYCHQGVTYQSVRYATVLSKITRKGFFSRDIKTAHSFVEIGQSKNLVGNRGCIYPDLTQATVKIGSEVVTGGKVALKL